EDLEDLWKIMKTKFPTSKPTNWTDDYLLATLKNMFKKTDAQDVLWKSQQTEHGQALVKSWKLLTSCEKSDAYDGFAQINYFLSGSYINYALTVSPHIYISCIKQFWNTAVVKRTGDVTRLQALVDKKKILISEDAIRETLQLDDAERVVPTHDDVDQENVEEETADDVAQPTSPLPPLLLVEGLVSANTAQQLEILKLKARVKKLDMLNQVKSSKLRRLKKAGTSQRIESSEDEENVFNHGRINVDIHEGIELVDDQQKDVQVKGRQADSQAKIYNIDLDHTSKVLSMQEDSEVQEVVEVVNAAKLITEVVTAANTQVISAAEPIVAVVSTPISAAKPKGLKAIPSALTSAKDKSKGIFVEDPKPMKKKDQIAMDAEYARKLQEEEESLAQTKDAQATDVQPKDAPAKGIQYIRRYHGYKKKPQSESQARKNMIDYLKKTEGFKMAFFKGKTYDQIRPIFQAKFDANMRFLLKSKEEMEKEE
nr:hypothetical protein [Tanacetum cinerariifolium]